MLTVKSPVSSMNLWVYREGLTATIKKGFPHRRPIKPQPIVITLALFMFPETNKQPHLSSVFIVSSAYAVKGTFDLAIITFSSLRTKIYLILLD
jgi:hypothetical protein